MSGTDPETPADGYLEESTSRHARRAVEGDQGSLGWVAVRYSPLLEGLVRFRLGPLIGSEENVRDAVQDVWLALLGRRADLHPRDGRLAPVLVRFLRSAAIHICNGIVRDHVRRRLGTPAGSGPAARATDERAARSLGVITRASNHELAAVIARAVAELPEDQRQILVLRIMEHRRNGEIAAMLGLTTNTVAVRYRRALVKLRGSLPAGLTSEILLASR
jgi:RNA polymerase sigma-70 factor (ECF subfamily)